MLRTTGLLGLLALIVAAAPAAGDDAYTIKVKKNAQGDRIHVDKQEQEKSSFVFEGPDGKALQQKKENKTVTQAYEETVDAKTKGKRAGKLTRKYTKAQVKNGDKESTLPFEGKTVVIEKKGGKYHFTVEGGEELTGKDAATLDRGFNSNAEDTDAQEELEKVFLPKKPIKAGESWDIDGGVIAEAMGKGMKLPFKVDKDRIKGKGKLVRAYKKDDRQFGVMEITVNMPLAGDMPLGRGQSASIKDGSKMNLKVTLDACIDGTASDHKANVHFDIDLTAALKGPDGKDFTIKISSENKEESTEKDLSAK